MKRRILLLAIPALFGAAFFLSEREPADSFESKSETETSFAEVETRQVPEVLETVDAGETPSQAEGEERIASVETTSGRRADNHSGVELGKVPAGVRRIDSVLFESRKVESDGRVRRSRVLETDFHFPLVQTIEWLEVDSASGEEKVDEYI